MGKNKNKQRAEFQFDSSAAPVSLGVHFESFSQYTIDLDLQFNNSVDLEEETYLFSDETENIDEDFKTIISLAEKIESTVSNETINSQQQTLSNIEAIESASILENEHFQDQQISVNHNQSPHKLISFHEDEIANVKGINPSMTSIRLVMLAIERLEEQAKSDLGLEKQDPFPFNEVLIDKSDSSIKLINHIGHKVEDYLLKKFRSRYKFVPHEDDDDRRFLDSNGITNNVDRLIHSAILAKYITKESVSFNTCPGFKLGCQGLSNQLTTFQILSNLKIRTMDINSAHFRNFERVVNNINCLYDVDLIHLKRLVSRARKFEIFEEHRSVTFSDEDDLTFDLVSFRTKEVLKDGWNKFKLKFSNLVEFFRN